MSNTAQINANRQNAQKSTGPRSAEGKAVVAKNAVKHGLFALESVIKGEKQEDFDLFHNEMLAELAPAGAVESMLAERFVSLSWRLARIVRIQDQVFDVMIEKDEPSPLNKRMRLMMPKEMRNDQRGSGPGLVLGRVAISDMSNSRVLERLLMYERRIENSMLKTMDELRRRRLMRELEQAREELSPDMIHAQASLGAATRLPQDAADKRFVPDVATPRQARGRLRPRSGLTVAATATAKREKYGKQSQFQNG